MMLSTTILLFLTSLTSGQEYYGEEYDSVTAYDGDGSTTLKNCGYQYEKYDITANVQPRPPSTFYATSRGDRRRQKRSNLVSGGSKIRIEDHPWTVALYVNESDSDELIKFTFRCQGVILNSKWILTTAVCVGHPIVREVGVLVGESRVPSAISTPDPRLLAVKGIFLHPQWSINHPGNNVALIQLSEKLNKVDDYSSAKARGTCLPRLTEDFNGEILAVGWGRERHRRDEEGGMLSLKQLQVDLVRNFECKKTYGLYDEDTQLCVMSPTCFERQQCEAVHYPYGFHGVDHGGPIMKKVENRYVTIGLLTHIPPCDQTRTRKPSTVIRLDTYFQWISDTIYGYNLYERESGHNLNHNRDFEERHDVPGAEHQDSHWNDPTSNMHGIAYHYRDIESSVVGNASTPFVTSRVIP